MKPTEQAILRKYKTELIEEVGNTKNSTHLRTLSARMFLEIDALDHPNEMSVLIKSINRHTRETPTHLRSIQTTLESLECSLAELVSFLKSDKKVSPKPVSTT